MATMPGSAPSSPAAVACSMTGLTIFIYTTDPSTRSADALRLLGILAATTAAEERIVATGQPLLEQAF